MLFVKQLFIYPIKSMQGLSILKADCTDGGILHDRILMVTEPDGSFITAREYPQLLRLKTKIEKNIIQIGLDSEPDISINLADFSANKEPTEVWGNRFSSHIGPIIANRYLSEFLQKEVQLRWIGQLSTRFTKHYSHVPVRFADAYPYLLLNKASFDYVSQQCPEKLDICQFRGNIIIDGALPFAEDGWKTIKIGEVIFDIVKPCSRCVMTTINTTTNHYLPDNEPLKTLKYFRADEQGEIDFGMNMIARNYGQIATGDPIEILEKQAAKNYIKSFPAINQTSSKTCQITFQDKIIKGNNKQTILEQLEQNNIALPYSCRSGICGRCQVHLMKGSVSSMMQNAIKGNNRILACSTIPKSDITIDIIKK